VLLRFLGDSKYCSWEPGHSLQAGALAVVTVAELLRNSDASSMERKEEDLVGRRLWYLYGVPRSFSLWGFCVENGCKV